MVGACTNQLSGYLRIYAKNAGGEIDLPEALLEMMNRGKAVPGGACGFCLAENNNESKLS